MDWRSRTLAAAAAVALALGGDAAAATYIGTWTGKVGEAVDYDGFFGARGARLTGKAFAATFTVDDAAPGVEIHTTSSSSLVMGAASSPAITAVLTINGHSQSFGAYIGSMGAAQLFGLDIDVIGMMAGDVVGTGNPDPGGHDIPYVRRRLSFEASGQNGALASWDYRVPAAMSTAQGHDFAGHVWIYEALTQAELHNPRELYAELIGKEMTWAAAPESAVPEPATWALLILGFGAAGVALRVRRVSLAA